MDKHGIDLAIDRIEALRVRIHGPYSHWQDLCAEALKELITVSTYVDRITALLALRRGTKIDQIALAVQLMVQRIAQLELVSTGDKRLVCAFPRCPRTVDAQTICDEHRPFMEEIINNVEQQRRERE